MITKKDPSFLKYPDDFVNKIVLGDALEIIKKLPEKSVDVILTDPPYGIEKIGIRNSNSLDIFYKILPECHRVLKDDSFFITFFSTKRVPEIFTNNPFDYFWQFVLYCPLSSVRSPIGFTKFMSCFVFKKGNPKMVYWNKDIFVDGPTKMIEPDEGYIEHPSPKPKSFVKELVKMFSKEEDIILDPFIGSGSTAMACRYSKRNFIGFEIEEKYCNVAKKRLESIGEITF